MDIGVTEHGIEPFEGLGCLGEDNYSADRTVKAMRQSHKDLAGLDVTLSDESLICFCKRFVRGLVALHNLPYLLVHNEKVVVFI